ncbi:hypothetical protein [Lyngbya sp. CCY1209]|uniref:hypothetical protein n=1 Tax=Lyngbya sp. CCY1209 TaxID=2886103 RepID=UPI002D205C3C|nr:hypothetical protein [Lyngbya sp. CCY1209]MEB3882099.1 hypothetical protein [Lyngbya sp. CCY1209]
MNLNAIKNKTLGDLLQHPLIQKFGRIIVFFLLIQILLFKLSGAVRSTWFSVEQAILPHSETTTDIRNIIIGELQEMNQLTTTQMSTKATVDVKDERNFLGGVPLGDTHKE